VTTARLTIVIPTRGRSQTLGEVLAALERQRPALTDVEVLVVADALAPPGRRPILRAHRPGASAARNAGWRAARSPLILFLDDDIVPTPRLVAEHLAWHERHPSPEIGVLGAVRWSPRVRVSPFMRWLEQGVQFDYGAISGVEAGWQRFYSCNVSLKRAALERSGGFDEDEFPFGYEDLELARRLARDGFRLLYNRRAVGEHLKTESLESWRRNLQRIAVAERRFIARYPGEHAYFYERFRSAADARRARGRAARLARHVPPAVPLIGPVVWRSYDMVCRQRLAPEFLAAWESAQPKPAASAAAR
jgi:GT2 family glycosyltransferase